MLVLLIVIKIVFRTANMLPTWNAPIGNVPRLKTEKQLLATSLPWMFALHVRILKTLKSPVSFLFYAYEIVFWNYEVPPFNENSFVLAIFIFSLLSSLLYWQPLPFFHHLSLQGSPSIGRCYEVAITAVRAPWPQSMSVCSLEASRWLVFNATF